MAGAVLNNIGRIVNQIPGITGVQASGTALINLPVNQRYHRMTFQVTNNGVAADPATVITSVKMLVNGTNMRDISPANIIAIAKSQGYTPATGELPIWFTSPPRNMLLANDSNSWDLFGQSTFSIQMGLAGGGVVPGLAGTMEFDFLRNLRNNAQGGQTPFLQPVAQHSFLFNLSGGQNQITTLPLDFPMTRLWLKSDNSRITLLEVYQDGNKIVEGTPAQLNQMYSPYGFALGGANPYETAAIFDVDSRWWKALKVGNALNVRVTLSASDNVTIVQETLPGSYQS